MFVFAVFKELQKESEFQRKEWFRKQGKAHTLVPTHALITTALLQQSSVQLLYIFSSFYLGPHFIEYLGYEVTPECCVVLKCKVRAM